MVKYRIEHVREECIGCGACASVSPTLWKMTDDGKSSLINGEKTEFGEKLNSEKDFELAKESAESCPVNCIHIFEINEDNTENKLF